MPQRRIRCPKCSAVGAWELENSVGNNDNEDLNRLEAPEGFRKVQLGWNAPGVYLVCLECGVPGNPDDLAQKATDQSQL